MSNTGYSETHLSKKLGIKAGTRVALIAAPAELTALLEPLPKGVRLHRRLASNIDLIVFFVTGRSQLDARFDRLETAFARDGALWVAWPKRASGVKTDLTENVIREIALGRGLVDTKVCAISDVWSGLRLVRRLIDR
jgi:hypothetical protein